MILIELAKEIGLQPKWAASTQGGEYKSSCPRCGGKDRFSVQPNREMNKCLGFYCCRQCDCRGDAIQFAMDFLGLSFKDAVNKTNASIETTSFTFLKREKKILKPVSIISPPDKWQTRATDFTSEAHKNICNEPDILKWLRLRGLPQEAVNRYQIGWCPHDRWYEKDEWGLEQCTENKKIWVPKGIVIPTFNKKGKVVRLKVRRSNWQEDDPIGKYIAVSGSMNGLNIIGDTRHALMIVVESELDGYALHHAIGDIVCIIAVGNNIKTPDEATNYHATTKEHLLICHDNDQAGKNMLEKWRSLYEHAKQYPTPIGKDIGEAITRGLDVRKWILINGWHSSPDKALIKWVLNYISNRTISRHTYKHFEQEIALGSNSPRAKTDELQAKFRLMQDLVNDFYKRKETTNKDS